MQPYCTPEDMAGRVPKHTLVELVVDGRDEWESLAVQAELVALIRQAQDKVDAALGAVTALPLATVTTQIKTLTLELACALAYLRRPPMPEGWGAVLQSAEATLRAISRGDIPVQGVPGGAEPLVDRQTLVQADAPLWDGGFWQGFRG